MSAATVNPAAPAPPAERAAKPKGKRRKLLILLPLVVLLVAGGLVAKSHFAGPSTPPPDLTKEAGAVVDLDPITLNLTDGRYLKAGLALQLSKAATPTIPAADSSGAAAATIDGAKALDAAISILGSHSYAQLLAPGGRAAAQRALSAEVAKRYDGKVLKVYFTEFVMQ